MRTRDRLEQAERKHRTKSGRPRCLDARHDWRFWIIGPDGTARAHSGGGGGEGSGRILERTKAMEEQMAHPCVESAPDVMVSGHEWPASMVHGEQCVGSEHRGKSKHSGWTFCPGGEACWSSDD